ncbi:hypothetical protein EJ04DRAFT_509730 [Polyplosphaeria fusca]|uniref:SprT-like domain-containing protein n=1 Tax=Polyplosphaeria fusca TaxID=682080 RepID=A0A9P4R775_9PLEO|nr:hypothetical protein EJ04DRAFT_509730 [Polyplosphaeria fusca]
MPPPPPPNVASRPPFRKGHSMISNWAQDVIDLTESPEPPPSFDLPTRMRSASLTGSASRPTTSSSYDASAVLRYSPTPTKQKSPHKAPPIVSRPSTPPLPPVSPSKLVSPSKMKNRIPHAPDLRPSLDAFWSADVVNDWNQQHSPSKPLMSPRKQKWLKAIERKEMGGSGSDSEDSCPSPTTSPRKKNASPSKAQSSPNVAQVRKECKEFRSKTRYAMAESFLKELDTTITGGKISEMSASTGGIKLIWTKTLKTTAGRANWRREQLRLKTGPLPTDLRTEIRHHCSIELAEKVIDTPDRLYNVLAHEYCHLTTFMISDVRTNPHGKAFRTWAARVSTAFTSHNVLVTTKHAYEISFKYVWECVKCGYEFKRHSKSVDPERHSCGRCQSRLVQTKPVPRAGGKGREKSEYQGYMKENFGRVRGELEARGMEAGMGRVVEEVARQYRVMKEGRKEKVEKEVDEVDEVEIVFERLKIGDEGL